MKCSLTQIETFKNFWSVKLHPPFFIENFVNSELKIEFSDPNEFEPIRNQVIDLDWKLDFELFRIHLDWYLGINRIKSDWFLTVFHHTRYKTFSGLVRNDSHWLGYRYRNEFQSDTFIRVVFFKDAKPTDINSDWRTIYGSMKSRKLILMHFGKGINTKHNLVRISKNEEKHKMLNNYYCKYNCDPI